MKLDDAMESRIAGLETKEPWALTHDEWLLLAVTSRLSKKAIQWRTSLAMLEDCMDQGISPDGETLDLTGRMALRLKYEEMFHGYPAPQAPLKGKTPDPSRVCGVYKYVPGDHFHVLDTKFDTLEEAKRHLVQNGYVYGGLELKHVYAVLGD